MSVDYARSDRLVKAVPPFLLGYEWADEEIDRLYHLAERGLELVAADAAPLLGPMAGHDPRDSTTSPLPVPNYAGALTGDIRGLRVGLLRAFFLEGTGVVLRQAVEQAVKRLDVLVAPATPIVATPVGQFEVVLEGERHDVRSSLTRLKRVFNLSGHPVCAVPCGFTVAGLPVGMQIVGRPFDEATVLRVADAYQRVTDWHTRRPPVGQEAAPSAPAP